MLCIIVIVKRVPKLAS